ncbi:hypothetical protein F5Y14DRAFT_461152 [Nemania sp. NC0429]|nr:hypothetical protein F5Y14DRAFT_461152 [Nemania sp. NC0429]
MGFGCLVNLDPTTDHRASLFLHLCLHTHHPFALRIPPSSFILRPPSAAFNSHTTTTTSLRDPFSATILLLLFLSSRSAANFRNIVINTYFDDARRFLLTAIGTAQSIRAPIVPLLDVDAGKHSSETTKSERTDPSPLLVSPQLSRRFYATMLADQAALLALSALTLVSAQANSNSTFKIPPNQVDPLKQSMWCNAQQDSCNTLCGSVIVNDCDPPTLDFVCECEGESFPDMNKFENTIPWFVCELYQANCIATNAGNLAGQKNCTATYQDNCGTESVEDHKGEGAATPTPTPSSSSSSVAPQSTSAPPASSTSSGAAAVATPHIHHIGNGAAAVALGLLAYAL